MPTGASGVVRKRRGGKGGKEKRILGPHGLGTTQVSGTSLVNSPSSLVSRFHNQALVEVSILNALRKKDEDNVYNVVHMKEYFHFRNHFCISFELLGYGIISSPLMIIISITMLIPSVVFSVLLQQPLTNGIISSKLEMGRWKGKVLLNIHIPQPKGERFL